MHRVAGAVIIVLALLTGCRRLPMPSDQGVKAPEARSVAIRSDLWARLNAERSARGLPALKWNGRLSEYGAAWSKKMATKVGFKHSDLSAMAKDYDYAGENIATGSKGVSAAGIHKGWMQSQGHRDDMLSPGFTEAGIGIYCAPNGSIWATTEFVRRWASGSPPPYAGNTPATPFARPDADKVTC